MTAIVHPATRLHPKRRRPTTRWLAGNAGIYLFLLIIAALTLLPLIYAFFASFKSLDELLTNGARLLPLHWNLDNYVLAWQSADFEEYFFNSLIVVVGVVGLDTIASSMLGYILARGVDRKSVV